MEIHGRLVKLVIAGPRGAAASMIPPPAGAAGASLTDVRIFQQTGSATLKATARACKRLIPTGCCLEAWEIPAVRDISVFVRLIFFLLRGKGWK